MAGDLSEDKFVGSVGVAIAALVFLQDLDGLADLGELLVDVQGLFGHGDLLAVRSLMWYNSNQYLGRCGH